MAKLSLHNLKEAGRKVSTGIGILEFDAEGVLKDAEKFPEEGLRELGKIVGFRLIDLEAIEKAKKAVEEAKKEDAKVINPSNEENAEDESPVKATRRKRDK